MSDWYHDLKGGVVSALAKAKDARFPGGGVAPLGLAFLLPLVDGGYVWEAFGNLVFSVLVAGAAVTHGTVLWRARDAARARGVAGAVSTR